MRRTTWTSAPTPWSHSIRRRAGPGVQGGNWRYREAADRDGRTQPPAAASRGRAAGIYYLRTVAECDAIKREAEAGRRAVVVGMGFIGCEVAASLTQLGVQVTAVFPGRNPLERVLGEQLGALIGHVHRSNGSGCSRSPGRGVRDRAARVGGAGRREQVEGDFAVVGVGIDPEVPAIAGSSVAQDNGILVDERCRSSADDVYAAGDVANHLHPVLGRIRVEHYNSAEHHGAAAARAMLGSAAPFDYVHNFFSDQYEHILQYVGHAASWDDFVFRGSLRNRKFVGFIWMPGSCGPPSASTGAEIRVGA